jgi:predicted phosphodiesterase
MNVLALYDIHGNVDALDAVLADPRAAAPDAVVVGGDAFPGPFARATLDRLAALDAPVHWVRGNGEREVGDGSEATATISAAEIGADDARRLAALPLTLSLDGVLYCHASPRSDEELLTRISTPARWAAALQGVQEPLVVAGHTHQQDDRTVGATRFVNAGSVGLPYEGDGAARWLWVADGVPHPRVTAYDNVAAGRRMLDEAGWPDEQSIAAALTDPIDPIIITELFEERASAA